MKKMIAFLLAMLLLTLPVLSLAEGGYVNEAVANGRSATTTVSFSAGDITGDKSVDDVIKDVLGALKVTVNWHSGENAWSQGVVAMSGKDILTFGSLKAEDVYYVLCNLLGERALAFKEEDALPLTERFIDLFVMMDALDESEAQEMKAMLTEGFAQSVTGSTMMMMEDVPEMDLSALIAFMESKMVLEPVTMQPRNSDPAVNKVTITITGEDMLKIWELTRDAILSNEKLMELIRANVTFEDGMTVEEAFRQATEEAQQLPEVFKEPMPLVLYMDAEDELVYATLSMKVTEEVKASGATVKGKIGASGQSKQSDTAPGESVTMDVNYARLTLNDKVTHAANMVAQAPDGNVSVSVNVIDGENNDEYRIDMGDGETAIGLYVTVDSKAEASAKQDTTNINFVVSDAEMSIDICAKVEAKEEKNGADAAAEYLFSLNLDEKELFRMDVQTVTGDPMPAMETENSIRLAQVSDEEFQNWFVDVVNGLQGWAMSAIQALPVSVLMLMMGQ